MCGKARPVTFIKNNLQSDIIKKGYVFQERFQSCVWRIFHKLVENFITFQQVTAKKYASNSIT